MTQQEANIALQFLQRVTLQPAEIDAYQAACRALQAVIQEQQEAAA